jgi:hypothetical protein
MPLSDNRIHLSESVAQACRLVVVEAARVLGYPDHDKEVRPSEDESLKRVSLLFVSRSTIQLSAITTLAQLDLDSDASALYRSMIERYLLHDELAERREFAVFMDYCYQKLRLQDQRILSNPMMKGRENVADRRLTPGERQRMNAIAADPKVRGWRRPKPEDTAQRLGLKFLYDGGFDYASSQVHPNAYDGTADYLRLVDPNRVPTRISLETTVQNSQLACVLLTQSVMNRLPLKWRSFFWDLFTAILNDLPAASNARAESEFKVRSALSAGMALSERVTDSGTT